jgi:hypothetical protein
MLIRKLSGKGNVEDVGLNYRQDNQNEQNERICVRQKIGE